MPYVVNVTPFQAQSIEHKFYNGELFDCIFCKATYRISHENKLLPLVSQPPFVINDLYENVELANFKKHPALIYPADIIPFKPATDIIVIGHAKPPAGLPCRRWLARVAIKGKIDKIVQLTGPRNWQYSILGGWQLSEIVPTSAVRLSYSLASGGGSIREDRTKKEDCFQPNPFGRGFLGSDKPKKDQIYHAPQILGPSQIDPIWGRPDSPAGLSAMDGQQIERLKFAGLYDVAWTKNVAPNIPLDMDLAFWNTVPQDQVVSPYLMLGATLETNGLFPTDDGRLSITLPTPELMLVPVMNGDKYPCFSMNLDTVILDLDKRHITLRWCAAIRKSHGFDEYQLLGYPGPDGRKLWIDAQGHPYKERAL